MKGREPTSSLSPTTNPKPDDKLVVISIIFILLLLPPPPPPSNTLISYFEGINNANGGYSTSVSCGNALNHCISAPISKTLRTTILNNTDPFMDEPSVP